MSADPGRAGLTGMATAVVSALRQGATAFALLAAVTLLPACSSAGAAASTEWQVLPTLTLKPGDAPWAAAGWACTQAVDLPAGKQRMLALCRRAQPAGPRELHLVLLPRAEGAAPQVLTRLGDASKASLRLLAPASACAVGPACLAALVLIDQRDEGLCYGTQVVAVLAGQPARSLGFIDEWSPAGGESTCIGAAAQVSGTVAVVEITLPGPLSRMGRDGKPVQLAMPSLRYRVSVDRPTLVRAGPGR